MVARWKANRLRIVHGLRPANNRPPGAASARLGAAAEVAGIDGALWSRLMNAIRRFYRSTTGPRDHRRPFGQSARGSATRRIDRPPAPLNSAARPARCTTRRIIQIFIVLREVERDRRSSRCLLIEANGIRPPRRCRPFLELVSRYLAICGSSTFLSAALARPPTTTATQRDGSALCPSLTTSRLISYIQSPCPGAISARSSETARHTSLIRCSAIISFSLMFPLRRCVVHETQEYIRYTQLDSLPRQQHH